MAHIQVHGRGVTLFVTEISAEIANELTETGVSIDRFEEIREAENTHAAGIRDEMEVFVDGRRISAPPEEVSQQAPIALEPGKHCLVVRETAVGRWLDIDTGEPFDPSKFSARVSTYLLSDGESITVTNVQYAGALQIGETEAIDEDATVIFPDGASADVLIAGEQDDDDEEDELVVLKTTSAAKPRAKSAGTKRAKAKTPPVKKPPAKGAAKKAASRKAAKTSAPKKAAAKKGSTKTTAPKKAPTKKTPARKATTKTTTKKAAVKKRAAKKAPAKKKAARSKR